jgi:4-aminobutyrate aminotransferase
MFASERDGIEPDILLAAKGLGSGMPIGAIIARESVMTWGAGAHGSTFGGNPVCCAAALATLDLVEGGLIDNAREMGARLLAGAQRLAEQHRAIRQVRGLGLMLGIEFTNDTMSRELVQRAFRRGLLLLGAGKTTVRLAPPLIIDDYDVETALGIIGEIVAELG